MYQNRFAGFVEFAFRIVSPNSLYRRHWLMEVVAHHLERCERGQSTRLIINLPVRYLKSLIVSVAFPAWILTRRPTPNVMCVTDHQNLSSVHHTQALRLMSDPKYQSLFSHVRAIERGQRIVLPHGGSRAAFTPNSGIIVIMQRLHIEDLTGHLLKHGDWELVQFPAIAQSDETFSTLYGERVLRRTGEPLNTELENRETLREAMLAMGARAFMAQYQQCPYPPGEGEDRCGAWSSLREGVHWTPDQPEPEMWFGRIPEERILLHTVFGEGEHPWLNDMRIGLYEDEETILLDRLRGQRVAESRMNPDP